VNLVAELPDPLAHVFDLLLGGMRPHRDDHRFSSLKAKSPPSRGWAGFF
jgi:hypothetical protein